MQNDNNLNKLDDEIDLRKIFRILWSKVFFISALTSVFAVFSVVYSLSLPNMYTSSALLIPASEKSLSSQAGQFSSVASLAGFNIPNEGNSKKQEAVQRIKSFEFFSKYFLPNIKLENLIALKEWDKKKNILIYDQNIFDTKTNQFVTKASNLNILKLSNQEAFEEIYTKILNVTIHPKTGFVSISIDHKSPFIAEKWLNTIILNINESMRELDKVDAENSITFLNESIKSTKIKSIRDVVTVLLENQMQILMLTYSQKDYIFKAIEPPIAPEKKSGPSRSRICILITLLGLIFSIVVVLIGHHRKNSIR